MTQPQNSAIAANMTLFGREIVEGLEGSSSIGNLFGQPDSDAVGSDYARRLIHPFRGCQQESALRNQTASRGLAGLQVQQQPAARQASGGWGRGGTTTVKIEEQSFKCRILRAERRLEGKRVRSCSHRSEPAGSSRRKRRWAGIPFCVRFRGTVPAQGRIGLTRRT
jgi:hypothetical protein